MRLVILYRILAPIVLSLALCAVPARAQTEEQLYNQFLQAKAREVAAAQALERSRAGSAGGEAMAANAAEAELASRRAEAGRLEEVNREISAVAEQIIFTGQPSPKLTTERAVLEEWYGQLQRVPGNLTERSFAGLEAELEGLAVAGLIEPGERRFRTLREVRTAIQGVSRRIEQQVGPRDNTEVRARLARLIEERDALLARIETDNPEPSRSAAQWMQLAAAAVRDANALFEAQQAVFDAYNRYAEKIAGQRPPALVSVTANQSGAEFYRAEWTGEAGTTPDEIARQRDRQQVLELRSQLQDAWEFNASERRDRHATRLELAERMMPVSRSLERSAQRYGAIKERAFWIGLGVDIGLTVAELALTGGTATLARKATDYGVQAAAKAAERKAARALMESAPKIERELLKEFASRGNTQADAIRAAARYAEDALQRRSGRMVQALMDRGVPSSTAVAQVERQIAETVTRLKDLDRLTRLASQGRAEQIAADRFLDSLRAQLPTSTVPELGVIGDEVLEEVVTKLVGNSPDIANQLGQMALGRQPEISGSAIPGGEAFGNALLGESIETAFTVGMNTYAVNASEGLAGMAKYTEKFGRGLQRNSVNLGIGIVSSAIEITVAGMLDEQVNAEARHFSKTLAELEFMYSYYRSHLLVDEQLAGIAARIAGEIAAVNGRLAEIEGGYRRSPPRSMAGKAEGDLSLALTFSSPLLAAPSVRAGPLAVPMRKVGTDGRQWMGTVSAATLGAGLHPIEVSVDQRSSTFGALDTDLSTAPRRRPGQQAWIGFEAGIDRSHSLRLDPVRPAVAQNEACPARMPAGASVLACYCPARPSDGSVWGTYYYTDDSALCLAARHAGIVTEQGGNIRVRTEDGRDYYTGSNQNGVASKSYGGWGRTLVFENSTSAEASLGDYPLCPGTYNAQVLGPSNGICRCPDTNGGTVWGTLIYTSDSSLCKAAAHAGVITSSGGIVRVELLGGRDSYAGSTRNGITSSNWGSWGSSIQFGPVGQR